MEIIMNKKNIPVTDDEEWGNIELPGLSDEELFNTNWNRVAAIQEMHKGRARAEMDPKWRKQRSEKQRLNNPDMRERIKASLKKYYEDNPRTEEQKYACGNNMRGRTLEEILGEERALKGRKARSEFHKGRKRPLETGQKIAQTRKANGSYDGRSMRGKEHKESTKSIMSQKAQVRQELKRKLGLGKSDSVPIELLEKEYKKRGW